MNSIAKTVIGGVLVFCGIIGATQYFSQTITDTISITEPISYTTQVEYDYNQRDNIRIVEQPGKDGSKTVIYRVVKNYRGVETSRSKVSEEIVTAPQTEIIVQGAKQYYKCSDGAEYETAAERDECNNRISWERSRNQALATCNADNNKMNCWYDEYPGTQLHWTERKTYSAPSNSQQRIGAICNDGWQSSATGRGACSHHGGVNYWLYR